MYGGCHSLCVCVCDQIIFAIALLASGQNSTLTGTLAGQITMEGFVHLRLAPWKRRLLTRALAIVPAVIVAAAAGDSAVAQLLVLSQVILSLQLSFAVVPLVWFTSREDIMGPAFVNSKRMRYVSWAVTTIIIGLYACAIVLCCDCFLRASCDF